MKTIADIEAIREKKRKEIELKADKTRARIVVGMATCGLAAGAGPVFKAFIDEVQENNLMDVSVIQSGCIGMCRLEPIAEVYERGGRKVTYTKLTPEKARQIVKEHLLKGKVCLQYTVGGGERRELHAAV